MKITGRRFVVFLVICVIALAAVGGMRSVTVQSSDPTAALLVNLIRVNTRNPPGHRQAARYCWHAASVANWR